MISTHAKWPSVVTACLFLCLVLGVLCLDIAFVATNENMMTAGFERYAAPWRSGVEAGEYPALAKAVAGYLGGRQPSAQVTVHKFGVAQDAFNETELLHLIDVKNILQALKIAGLALIELFVLGACVLYAKGAETSLKDALRALKSLALCLLGAIAALLVWCLNDFDAAFVAMHELLFTNDLWLLNPYTDLLLQMMPTDLFVWYAQILLLHFVLWAVLWSLLIFVLYKKEQPV